VKITACRVLFSNLVTEKDIKYNWLSGTQMPNTILEVTTRYPDIINYPAEMCELITDKSGNAIFHRDHACTQAFVGDMVTRRDPDGYCYDTFRLTFEEEQNPVFVEIVDAKTKLDGFDLLRGQWFNADNEICDFKLLQILIKNKDLDENKTGIAKPSDWGVIGNKSNCTGPSPLPCHSGPFSPPPVTNTSGGPMPPPVTSGPSPQLLQQMAQIQAREVQLQAELHAAKQLLSRQNTVQMQANAQQQEIQKLKTQLQAEQSAQQYAAAQRTATQTQLQAQLQAAEAARQVAEQHAATQQAQQTAAQQTLDEQHAQLQAAKAASQAAEQQAAAQQAQQTLAQQVFAQQQAQLQVTEAARQAAEQQAAAAQQAHQTLAQQMHAEQTLAQQQVQLQAAEAARQAANQLEEAQTAQLELELQVAQQEFATLMAQTEGATEKQTEAQQQFASHQTVNQSAIERARAAVERVRAASQDDAGTNNYSFNQAPPVKLSSLQAAARQVKQGGFHGADGNHHPYPPYIGAEEGFDGNDGDMSTIDGGGGVRSVRCP
jgi:hypothetical protein